MENTSLLIKIYISPFKVLSIDCNTLMAALSPILKTLLVLNFWYIHQGLLFFPWYISYIYHGARVLNSYYVNFFLICLNRKKLQGDKSDESEGCWTVFKLLLVKNSLVRTALCKDALLCKIHYLFLPTNLVFSGELVHAKGLWTPK